ncbi:MAG: prepilin-type N-terminal cleavage/methylation domain-containing protein, partial [Plesiomonas shigelloides]
MSDAVMQVKTKPDRGFSLVELMIAMALGSLLI